MKLSHPVVVLFGAGATRGGLRTNVLPPPVDADFFEIAGQIKGHGTPWLARTVLGDVRTLYGKIFDIGLEVYYRDIETRAKISSFAKTANKPKDWQKRQENLEELIRRVVIHTTCASKANHLTPVRSTPHTDVLVVEAAGVEPASENVAGKEPTYLVQFTLSAFAENFRRARSERTRNARS
jgi:hypothetical protein